MGNPMDAFRKAEKAKQLRKNASDRKKKRDDRAVHHDTRHLEAEIKDLKARDKLSNEGQERLSKLQSELKYFTGLKEKFVSKNPDQRDKVYHTDRPERAHGHGHGHGRGPRGQGDDDGEGSSHQPDPTAHLYNPDGTLRDPKRSYYYDATYNPFGVPPPGMPYRARTQSPEPSESSDDSDDDSDDDIVMPEGPPPGAEDSDSDDSDDSLDIPLPSGPPPSKTPAMPMLPNGLPAGWPPFMPPPVVPTVPFSAENPGGWGHLAPTPPIRPPRGPQRTRGGASGSASSAPRPSTLPPPPSSLPAKPGLTKPSSGGATMSKQTDTSTAAAAVAPPAAVTISAAPQLRDLRKETTVFVPRGVNKRKAPGGLAPVNSTPNAGTIDAEGDEIRVKRAAGPGLMGKLQGVIGAPQAASKGGEAEAAEDEYARFLEGLE